MPLECNLLDLLNNKDSILAMRPLEEPTKDHSLSHMSSLIGPLRDLFKLIKVSFLATGPLHQSPFEFHSKPLSFCTFELRCQAYWSFIFLIFLQILHSMSAKHTNNLGNIDRFDYPLTFSILVHVQVCLLARLSLLVHAWPQRCMHLWIPLTI